MDRIVDHLFVFEGNGIIKDFRGTYTEYKTAEDLRIQKEKEEKNKAPKKASAGIIEQSQSDAKKKLSYMEKRELEQLGKDIERGEKRKEEINKLFDNKDLAFDEIKKLSIELGDIIRTLDIKEQRRFELTARE
jgi:ATP-binding cassette subfamily F protein uup